MEERNSDRTPRRVLVIGIDAATMDLIRPWAETGRLPTFARLFREGASGLLRSVPNRNSAAAWTSIMTGKNPGKHGIFFFTENVEESLDYRYVNGSFRDGATLWRLLGDAGLRVGVMNVPMTYPADEVNGFLIGGMDAPSVDDARLTYPPDLYRELRANVGEYTIEVGLGSYVKAGKLDEGVRALQQTTERRLAAARYLMATRPWDFFMVVFRNADPAQHYFWKYMEPQWFQVDRRDVERYGSVIPDVYRQIDAAIGELIELAGEDTIVMLVSDHGGCPNTAKATALPGWLEAMGMLRYEQAAQASPGERLRRLGWNVLAQAYRQVDKRFSREFKKRLSHRFPSLRTKTEAHAVYSRIDWSVTKAYGDGRQPEIWINLRGRQPYGIVEPGEEYEQVCAAITEKLYAARDSDSGRPLVKRVYRRDEVYHGKHAERSADLVIEWEKNAVTDRAHFGDGTAVLAERNHSHYLLERPYSGVHDPMGIFFLRGDPVRAGATVEGATVMDIAPTVLYLMGQPVPDDMDGRILSEALEESYVADRAPTTTEAPVGEPVASATGYSEKDEAIIGDRLRGLGYID